MPIYDLSKPSKRAKFLGEPVDVGLIHRSLTLPETIHVDDCIQVGSFVVAGESCRFPNRSFGAFTITKQNVSVVRNVIQMCGQSIAEACRQPLSQRSSRHIDPGHFRRRMALEIAI